MIDREALIKILDAHPEHNTNDEVNALADALILLFEESK